MSLVQSRQPAGSPAGGRFAPVPHPEPVAVLEPAGDADDRFDPSPGMAACPDCAGDGEVRHPLYGVRNCPDPTATCSMCGGTGELLAEAAKEIETERSERARFYAAAAASIVTPPVGGSGDEEPF